MRNQRFSEDVKINTTLDLEDLQDFEGVDTATSKTVVDPEALTITTTVLKTPKTLTVKIPGDDEEIKEVTFDGSENAEIDLSELNIGGKLQEELTATTTVGGIKKGTTFAKGTSLEDILKQLLTGEVVTYKMYWGVTDDIPTGITSAFTAETVPDDLVTAGASHTFVSNRQHDVYAYPKLFGEVKGIYNLNFPDVNLLSKWPKIEVTYNDLTYYLYYQAAITLESGSTYSYKFVI